MSGRTSHSDGCEWCGRPKPPQRAGLYAIRFCSAQCRQDLHTAARRWGLAAYDAGLVTAETLRNAPAALRDRRETTPKRRTKTEDSET